MKVAFNPVVNFKSNYIEDWKNGKPQAFGETNPEVQDAASVAESTGDKFVIRDMPLEDKVAEFQSALKNRKWEKKYIPESDIVFVKQKKVDGGIEYVLEKDGTVRETGEGIKSMVIMEPSSKMSEKFAKIKSRQYKDPKEKKPGNFLTRGISNILTFFYVTSTMATATVKGLYYGVITGAGAIVASTVLRLPELLKTKNFLDVCKNPLKSAGKGGRIVAAVASLAVLAYYVISGRLAANEKAAKTDHRWLEGHD